MCAHSVRTCAPCACGCILCIWVRYVRVSAVNVWVGSARVGAFCAHGYAMYT